MHYEYFFQIVDVRTCFYFLFENSKNMLLIDGEWYSQFHGDFTIKTGVGFVRRNSFEKGVIRRSIFIHMQYFSC